MKPSIKNSFQTGNLLKSFWLVFLCLGSAALTLGELVLIDRKAGILTGGFLAAPVASAIDASLLAVTVFLANAALVSIPFQLALWYGDRRQWWPPRGITVALFVALSPIILVDEFWYQISKYFGDNVSFFLLKVIGDGSLSEMLSQSNGHLFWLVLTTVLTFMLTFAAIGLLLRRLPFLVWPLKRRGRLALTGALIVVSLVMVAGAARKAEALHRALRKFPGPHAMLKILEFTTDWDRDGSGVFAIPSDPSPWDAAIYPYAPDLPGNGLDENGIFGDLPVEAIIKESDNLQAPVFKNRPNFILLVLESFRRDLIFGEFQGKEVTPHLNRLAKDGQMAQWAFCHNGFTIGALKAIFLGNARLNTAPGTLIDDFNANGYQTAIFSGEDESFGGIAGAAGFQRADHFYDARQDVNRRNSIFTSPGSLTVPGEVVLERLARFLRDRGEDPRPLFLYVNFQDGHFPYTNYAMKPLLIEKPLAQSEIRPKNRERVFQTYLNTAANVDTLVGELLEIVDESLKGELAILVTADHGESLFDEGFLGHGHHLNEIQTRIPFIVKGFPAQIEEPLGLDEYRLMIHRALSLPPKEDPQPRVVEVEDKKVFQYIGNLARPVHIGWVGRGERWTIDLHHLKGRKNDGPWQKLDEGPESEVFRDLVHYWEALQLLEISGRGSEVGGGGQRSEVRGQRSANQMY